MKKFVVSLTHLYSSDPTKLKIVEAVSDLEAAKAELINEGIFDETEIDTVNYVVWLFRDCADMAFAIIEI